ncbi:MAG: DUF5615 family PIN-like protein [Planctomycetota bacterium]|jgi:predicted nuclease of predicted toxin-antitoxin system
MRFKIDENLPVEIIADLRAAGHDAESVMDEGLSGSPDPRVLERAKREARVFFTMDKGVGDIRRYPPGEYPGIVLFRPRSRAGPPSRRSFVAISRNSCGR